MTAVAHWPMALLDDASAAMALRVPRSLRAIPMAWCPYEACGIEPKFNSRPALLFEVLRILFLVTLPLVSARLLF